MYTPLNWTTTQRHVAFASFTSWMLDAFDFFILVFVLSDLAEWFHASVSDVSIAIMLTLAVRPIGIWPNGGKVRTSTDTDAQYSVLHGV